MNKLQEVFKKEKFVIGVVHLAPLPGSPLYKNNFNEIVERAVRDAEALYSGGVDGVLIENLGDVPYFPKSVPKITVAAMTYIVKEIRDRIPLPLGINVLRNDAIAALSIAYVTNSKFIRVNVLTEAVVTDQGLIEGVAHKLLRLKKYLTTDILLFADVHVKHGYPLMRRDILESIRDCYNRGLCDAIILTGKKTGEPPKLGQIIRVRSMLNQPILIGSGINERNVREYISLCDGIIIGTYFKRNGIITNPVDEKRVRKLIKIIEEMRHEE